jgi:hypothetical protein
VLLSGAAAAPDGERIETVLERPRSQMRLFARPAAPNRPFVVTLYLKDADGQTVRLELPPGFQLVEGVLEQRVATETGKKIAAISWTVRAVETGEFNIKAVLSDGTVAEESMKVCVRSLGFECVDR